MNTGTRIRAFMRHVVIDEAGGCWVWTGRKSPSGGRYGTGGYGFYASTVAHRYIFTLLVGPIPSGYQLDHLCRNTACVNPEHLEPVTPAENTLRFTSTRTHCIRGHEYTPENTRLDKNTRNRPGYRRVCRTCERDNARRARARREAASA